MAWDRFQRRGEWRREEWKREGPGSTREPGVLLRLASRADARVRPAWAALAAAMLLVAIFAVPPLRAAALELMHLFRVEKVTVAEINPGDLPDRLRNSAGLSRILSDQVQVDRLGEAREVASTAEATEAAGFQVRLPETMGAPSRIVVEPGARVKVRVDLSRLKEVLREINRPDIELPAAADGQEIAVRISPCVHAEYGDSAGSRVLIQIPSPEVSAPAGLPIEPIGEAFLEILGMTREEARQFSRTVDWSTTLVVPLPRDGGEYRQVKVDGVEGTLVRGRSGRGRDAAVLLWVKEGMLFALVGSTEPSELRMSAAPRVAERSAPAELTLSVGPNPSRDPVEIRYTLPVEAGTQSPTLDIYDVSGRVVRHVDLAGGGGAGSVHWNGANDRGQAVAPGLYYARLQAGNLVATTRISRVR